VVETLPAADGAAALFEARERTLVHARLGVDELGDGVDPREADRGLRIHALVEDRSRTVASAVRRRVAPAAPIASSRPSASNTRVGAMRLSR